MATLRKMTEFNVEFKGNFAYKEIEGFQFNFVENQIANQLVFLVPLNLTQPQLSSLQAELKKAYKGMRLSISQFNHPMVTFLWQGNLKGLNLSILNEITNGLVEILKTLQIEPHLNCPFCGKDEPDTTISINGLTFKGHQSCKTEEIEKIKNTPVEIKKNPVFQSIIGAFFGAILGSIPWILVDLFVGFYAAILGVLIGYSAFFFYKKFGGVVVNYTKYIIVVVTLLGVVFANFAIASYIILNSDGILVLENYIIVYTDPEIAPIMLQSLGIGMLISLFSLPTIFKKVKSEENSALVIE